MTHKIKNPNSLYVPELRRCLLSPQHWVKEAKDNYPRPKGTRMDQDNECYYLNWGQAKYRKSVPYDPSSNVRIMYTPALSHAYRAFTTTFKVLEAPFFQREKVLQFPGHGHTINEPDLVPEEFMAEENVNYCRDVLASEGANADDKMVEMSNLLLPPQEEEPSRVIRRGPLTFDPSPLTQEAKDIQLTAADDQAKLICWHHLLGHLSFPKLNQLALIGKIPKKLAKVQPTKCAGCLFGAIMQLHWQGKETKANHEVVIATKPGECILVDQTMSTEVGFYAQLKGKLTKKCYKCTTIFVNHFSRLQFVYLQLDDGSAQTLAAKLAFKQYVAEHGVKIMHYHSNNGRFHSFHDNAFQQACHNSRQPFTFCGVNTHFQNGIAKQAI